MAVRSPILNVMGNAALKAARGLIRDFGEVEQLQVSVKGVGEFVSTADLRAERTLKSAQRRVSRRTKGSNRRRKAVTLLARAHQTVRRQRQDFHHKTALALVRANNVISHERLPPANMAQHHHLAKSISDAGWGAFLIILTDKAACAGRRVVAVNPASTAQTCSGCGIIIHKGLSARWHSCPECGTSLQRDHNAAKNRERLGQSLRGGVA